MPAPDGHRRIAHMLVDAQARDFELVDPTPADIIRTPPTVSFTVETGRFSGRVSIIYLRADDAYAVALHRDDEQVERRDDVYFDMRSEEHTSELQSLMRISYVVFCLKKNIIY